MLASAGFQDVTNVLGGLGGAPQMGHTGWVQAGLPVETAADAAREYDALQKKARTGTPLTRDRAGLPRLGAPARVGLHRPRRAAVRMGHWTGSRISTCRPAIRAASLQDWGEPTVARSDEFYARDAGRRLPCSTATCSRSRARSTRRIPRTTPSARATFPDRSPRGRKRAVLVLPQWNSDAEGHVGLCRLLNRFGISALRLSLPYHDERMPPELTRADYIVSANVGRTAQVCRQAVLDARRAIAWLHAQGYESIGILGTSLGSCLAMLTTAHEPLIKAAALNHISPYFADVVWDGLSTMHVRETLEGNVTLDELRRMWLPISPLPFLERVRGRDDPAGLRALRSDVPGRSVADAGERVPAGTASRTSCWCCRAATTAPASRRSSGWTG